MISNYHTHSLFCDGKNTPEEMVQEAIRLGCPAIGFSGHSDTPFDPDYCMDGPREQAYREEVRRLQQVCADRISVYLGLEQDYYSTPADPSYQYVIGSVHYVEKNGEYLSIDNTPEILQSGIRRMWGGDVYRFCEDYYTLEEDVFRKTGCQIVGHFDLVEKFNENSRLFDPAHPRYRKAALEALHSLLDQGALLEINTGAISRGWRTVPYPAPFLLEAMGKRGAEVILSSDAHRKEDLLFGLEQAEQLCREYGLKPVNC